VTVTNWDRINKVTEYKALKLMALGSFETSVCVTLHATHRHIPEEQNHQKVY